MLRFLQFILMEARMSGSGKSGARHFQKYVVHGQPLTLGKDHEGIESGTELNVENSSEENGKYFVHVRHPETSQLMKISLNRFEKRPTIGNTQYGRYYEAVVAHHINNAVQSANGNEIEGDPYKLKKYREDLISSPELIRKAESKADESATEYLKLLQKPEKEGGRGIKLTDVESVHHTHEGIRHVTGNPEHTKTKNPHDVLLKLKGDNRFVGASLKGGQETISNNGFSSISIDGKTLSPSNMGDVERSADEHASLFRSAPKAKQREHIRMLLKGNPDVPLDRVGYRNNQAYAERNQDSDHIRAVNNPNNEFAMHHVGNGVIHISMRRRGETDWTGLGRIAHRISGGYHRVDGKLLKRSKAPEEEQPTIPTPIPKKKPVQDVSGRIDHGHVTTNAPF